MSLELSHLEAFERIKKYEENNLVENIKIEEIQIWPLIKFSLFRTLTGTENKNSSFFIKILNQLKSYSIKNIFKSYFMLKNLKSENLAFSFADARRKINKKYYDVIFDLNFKEDKIKILEWGQPKKHIGESYKYENLVFLDYLSLKCDFKTFFDFFILKKRKKISIYIDGINSDHIQKISNIQYLQFKNYCEFFYKYFKKKDIKKIYIKTSYTPRHQAIIYAARKLGIETIECQHGIISKYHPGYIYLKEFNSNLFPNNLLVFGKRVKQEILENSVIYKNKNLGFYPYLTNLKKILSKKLLLRNKFYSKFNIDITNKKVILVTSQWLKRNKIKDNLLKVLKDDKFREKYIFLLKTHPLEKDSKDFYKDLFKFKDNFHIFTNEKISVYELFFYVDYHTSFFSTCVFESFVWGIPNILFKDDDSKNLENIDEEFINLSESKSIYLENLKNIEKKKDFSKKVLKYSNEFYIK